MITNMLEWMQWQKNNTDDYGKAIVDVAREAMRILDEDETALHDGYYPDMNTPHGIIVIANKNIEAGGITGFMAGCVAQIITTVHSRGEEFKTIWNEPYGIDDAEGAVNPAIMTIDAGEGDDSNEVNG